jgi:hypothetical protein
MNELNYTPEHLLEQEMAALESLNDFRADFTHMERACEVMMALESIYTTVPVNGTYSDRDLQMLQIASEMAVTGTVTEASDIYGLVLSQEGFLDRVGKAIAGLWHAIKVNFAKIVDNIHYYNTYFNTQRGRVRKVKDQLHGIPSSARVQFKHHSTKYMLHGTHATAVSSFAEYVKQFQYLTGVLEPFLDGSNDLADDDLFTGLDHFKAVMSLNAEEYFTDRFKSLNRTLGGIASKTKAKASETTPVYIEYESEIMLGLGYVSLTIPNPKSYDLKEYRSLVDAHKHFYMFIDRQKKIDMARMFRGEVEWEATAKDVSSLLDDIEHLCNTATKLLNIATKWSVRLVTPDGAYSISSYRAKEENPLSQAFAATRIMNRISGMLYDTVASGYTYGMGNVKTGLSVAETAVKRLSKVS